MNIDEENEIKLLMSKLHSFKMDVKQRINIMNEKDLEIWSLTMEMDHISHKIRELESIKITRHNFERERFELTESISNVNKSLVNNKLNESYRDEEVERLKNEFNDLNQSLSDIKHTTRQNIEKAKKGTLLTNQLLEKNKELNQSIKNIDKNKNYEEEINKIKSSVTNNENLLKSLRDEKSILDLQCQEINNLLNNVETDLEKSRVEFELESSIKQKTNEELKNNKELIGRKNNEVLDLKEKIVSNMEKLIAMENKKNQVELKYNKVREDIEKLETDYDAKEKNIRLLEKEVKEKTFQIQGNVSLNFFYKHS